MVTSRIVTPIAVSPLTPRASRWGFLDRLPMQAMDAQIDCDLPRSGHSPHNSFIATRLAFESSMTAWISGSPGALLVLFAVRFS